MAVRATAIGSGKKIAKAGSKITPRPNPENRVMADAKNAIGQTIRYSINESSANQTSAVFLFFTLFTRANG
jgi:hypothetical protein